MTWDSRENGRKDVWSIFQGRLHGRLLDRFVRSLIYHVRRTCTDVLSSATFRFYSWRVSLQYTIGTFNPFCVSFQSKKRKLKKSSKRKTPATEVGEGEGETTTSDSKVSEGCLVHVALRFFRTSIVTTPHILQLLLFADD